MSVQNGTYKILTLDPDATTSVRRKEQRLDKTTSVRHAAQNYADNTPNTFGTKKKSKAPAVIAAILATILFAGGGFVAYPHIANMLGNERVENGDGSGEKQNEIVKYSKNDNEQIESI